VRALAWVALLGIVGCSGNTPESVAGRFVGRYYVEIDHSAALELATGSAAERIRREVDLLAEARRAGMGPPPDRPRVYFEQIGEPELRGGGTRLTFKLTIHVPAERPLERVVALDLRKVGDAWRVADFSESSVP
jgi:hypothetical protein